MLGYGPTGPDLAAGLTTQVQAWDAAGRPGTGHFRISAPRRPGAPVPPGGCRQRRHRAPAHHVRRPRRLTPAPPDSGAAGYRRRPDAGRPDAGATRIPRGSPMPRQARVLYRGGMNSGPTTHLETEQKYDAEPGFVMPDFSALPGYSVAGPERYELSATYFDTENLDLVSHRITLRRRTGGTDDAWHLKLPVRAGTRREVHLPLSEGTGTVPAQLQAMVADVADGQPLDPIALLETVRTVRRLIGADGTVLAEVADDEVTARAWAPAPRAARCGGTRSRSSWCPGRPVCWRPPGSCSARRGPARRRPRPSSGACSPRADPGPGAVRARPWRRLRLGAAEARYKCSYTSLEAASSDRSVTGGWLTP